MIGAWSGGEFTNMVVHRVGTNNLLPVAAFLVILAYAAFRVAAAQKGVALAAARAGEDEEVDFSIRDMVADVVRTRHLQVIVGIMVMMFLPMSSGHAASTMVSCILPRALAMSLKKPSLTPICT